MALEIKLAVVCQRTFEELAGESEVRRYCNQCQLFRSPGFPFSRVESS